MAAGEGRGRRGDGCVQTNPPPLRAQPVQHILPGKGSKSSQNQITAHPSLCLFPNTPPCHATSLPLPFPLSSSYLLTPASFATSFPFCSLPFLKNWSAELHLQSALTLNSLILPSAASLGLSLLPLLFLTAPKKSLNIHFSLLFQTVLKINFKIFLLDPVI